MAQQLRCRDVQTAKPQRLALVRWTTTNPREETEVAFEPMTAKRQPFVALVKKDTGWVIRACSPAGKLVSEPVTAANLPLVDLLVTTTLGFAGLAALSKGNAGRSTEKIPKG